MREQPPWEKYYCRRCRREVEGDTDFCEDCLKQTSGLAGALVDVATAAVCINCGERLAEDATGSMCDECADKVRSVSSAPSTRDPRIPEPILSVEPPSPPIARTLRERIFVVGVCLGVIDFVLFSLFGGAEGWLIGLISGLGWIGLAHIINYIIGPSGDTE